MIQYLFGDRPIYVTPDPQSVKEAEEAMAREVWAQSRVISGAKRDNRPFWRRVDAALTGERKGS